MKRKTNLKYKVGDRVIYHSDNYCGNPDLDGWAGKIIGVDGSATPYTVEFDDSYIEALPDERFGGKTGHCWHCTESHLTLEAEKSELPSQTVLCHKTQNTPQKPSQNAPKTRENAPSETVAQKPDETENSQQARF